MKLERVKMCKKIVSELLFSTPHKNMAELTEKSNPNNPVVFFDITVGATVNT